MERFTVNGTAVDFDPFDLDAMDAYLGGLERVDRARSGRQENEGPVEFIRRICNTILDFFDDLLGEGRAEELFGQRVNAKAIFDGYRDFTAQVNACIQDYSKDLSGGPVPPAPGNRAQRRREERRR